MARSELTDQNLNYVLRLLLLLIDADVVTKIARVWQSIRSTFSAHAHEGMYEVLDYETVLELHDAQGEEATFHKRQKVRFKQNNIIAFQDQAWGDGDIFASYRCVPGYAVDRYKEGHRYRILISLRQAKRRGEIEEFRIERTIKHGFRESAEFFQTEVDHQTHSLSSAVIFPVDRQPRKVVLVRQNIQSAAEIGHEQWIHLPDGRVKVTWSVQKPHLHEGYVLRWEW